MIVALNTERTHASPEIRMYTLVSVKITLGTVDLIVFLHRLRCQVLEHPMRDTIPSVIRQHIVRVGADVIETRKAVLHNLRHASGCSDQFRFVHDGRRELCCRRHGTKYR